MVSLPLLIRRSFIIRGSGCSISRMGGGSISGLCIPGRILNVKYFIYNCNHGPNIV